MKHDVIAIRPVTRDDYELILAWWGIPEIRKFTSTLKQPSFAELADQFRQPGRRDFMIIHERRRIGRTCLIDHQQYEELSLYVGELALHGRGIGTAAICLTAKRASKPLRARVMKSNIASMKAFVANGFTVLSEDDVAVWLTQVSGARA